MKRFYQVYRKQNMFKIITHMGMYACVKCMCLLPAEVKRECQIS